MTPSTAFHAAYQPWKFTDLKGREHEARPLGHVRAIYWLDAFKWAGNDPWRIERTVSRFASELFPAHPRYWATVKTLRLKFFGLPLFVVAGGLFYLHLSLIAVGVVCLGLLASLSPGEVWPWLEFRKLPGPQQMAAIHDFFLQAGVATLPPRMMTSSLNFGSSTDTPTRNAAGTG